MDFWLKDEQKMLRYNIREFAEQEIAPVAMELDEKEEFSYDLTRKMAKLGLFGIYVPAEYGGSGMDYLSYIVAVEEICRIDGSHGATVAAGNSWASDRFIITAAKSRRTNGCRASAPVKYWRLSGSPNPTPAPMRAPARPTRGWKTDNGW